MGPRASRPHANPGGGVGVAQLEPARAARRGPFLLIVGASGVSRNRAFAALEKNDGDVDRALVELTDTAGLNGAARKKAAKKTSLL